MGRIRLKCPKLLINFLRNVDSVRRQVPVVFDVMMALLILCILLLMDIVWLGRVHTREVRELEAFHNKDLQRFRKQYDAQMHDIDSQHRKLGSDLESAHAEEVDRLKLDHHQDLEKKISSIQDELKGLLALSKTYWEKHADQHHVEIQFQAPGINGNAEEET